VSGDEVRAAGTAGHGRVGRPDGEGFAGLFADVFSWHDWTLPEPITGRDTALAYVGAWMTAFPDLRVRQVSRVVGDDAAAADVEYTGTNTGTVMGGNQIPPMGKAVTGRGSYIVRVRASKVTEFRSCPDVAGMMMQLGFMPAM
jgi:predicted ester cyclase